MFALLISVTKGQGEGRAKDRAGGLPGSPRGSHGCVRVRSEPEPTKRQVQRDAEHRPRDTGESFVSKDIRGHPRANDVILNELRLGSLGAPVHTRGFRGWLGGSSGHLRGDVVM